MNNDGLNESDPQSPRPLAPEAPIYLGQPLAPRDAPGPEVNEDEDEDIEGITPDSVVQGEPEMAISWQASEYVHHHKGALWYVILASVFIVLLVVAIIFHLYSSVFIFLVCGTAVAVFANKAPRILTYGLDDHSISIANKTYPYKNFRSFAVVQDIEWHSIDLEPTQRFMPRLTLLFSDEDLPAIVEHLSLHLPRTDRQPDMVERFTRFIRF